MRQALAGRQPIRAVGNHRPAERQQFLRGHVVLGVIGAPGADYEIGIRFVVSMVDRWKHRVLLFVRAFAGSGFLVVVGADQLPIERFTSPVVPPFAGDHGVMDGQSILLHVAGAATFLIALAQRHRLALHPGRIGQSALRRHPFRCWRAHRLNISARVLSLRHSRVVVLSHGHAPIPCHTPGLRQAILVG